MKSAVAVFFHSTNQILYLENKRSARASNANVAMRWGRLFGLYLNFTLSTFIFLNAPCSILKFCMYSCSRLVRNLTRFMGTELGNSISIYWQYAAPIERETGNVFHICLCDAAKLFHFTSLHLPVHNSSILLNWEERQSFTHSSISWRDKLSVVTLVEYTFTAILNIRICNGDGNKQ